MVNRKCDFCQNSYNRRPDIGYFAVTPLIRQHLSICEDSQRDYMCSEHFKVTCFDDEGRLLSGSLPTFFPQRLSKDLDHNYSGAGVPPESEDEGTF